MKIKKILLSLLLVISLFFVTSVEAATAPNTFSVNTNSFRMLNYLGGITFSYKSNSDNKNVYCMNIHDNMVGGTITYTLDHELGANYGYILENGYPNKSITGNNDKDYFITGLAVWYLLDPTDSVFTYINLSNGTYKGASNDVVQKVANLVNGSKTATYVTPSITASNSNVTLSLTSDKKYYVSSQLGVNKTGNVGNYTVALNNAPSGTIVTDTNGTTKTTFGINDKFIVKVPVSSISSLQTNFSASITAVGTVNKAFYYKKPANNTSQNLAALYPVTNNVSTSINFKISNTNEVRISKQDVTTNKELPGATLALKYPNGTTETWVSTNTPKVFSNLAPGKYTLTETIAPEGYTKSSETITFTVANNGTVDKSKVVMKNVPKGSIYISKQDMVSGEEVPGATLVLKDSTGKVVDTWVSGTTPHKVELQLPNGEYTLTETLAPNGYVRAQEEVRFTVNNQQVYHELIVMKNKLKDPIVVSKQDATTGEELPGATLVLKDSKGNVVDEWVSGVTAHKIENLAPGKYTLTETIAPNGYIKSTETVTFTVDEDGKVKEPIIMKNKPIVIHNNPKTGTTLVASLIVAFASFIVAFYFYADYRAKNEM